MEALGAPQSLPPAAAATSAVLGDDDLLSEILLRVAFPVFLRRFRAALVCKDWLRLASDPVFLRRFRDLHPPSLLGFYVNTGGTKPPRFLPTPQPPELAAVVRRANFDLGNLGSGSLDLKVDCSNGLLLLTSYFVEPRIRMVRCPLYPSRSTTTLPPVPNTSIHGDGFTYDEEEILPNSGGDGFFYLAFGWEGRQTIVDVYVLQDDIWAIYSSVVSEITGISRRLGLSCLIGDGRIYNLACVSEIDKLFVLDLVSSSLSLVNLPEEVLPRRGRLSLADDFGVHLTHVKDLQIRIWLHRMDSNGVANWFLVNTICLHEICGNHMISIHLFEVHEDADDYFLEVHELGFNSEFVFIETHGGVLYLFDIKRKAAKRVYEVTQEDKYLFSVSPFMMVWPPKFPTMKE